MKREDIDVMETKARAALEAIPESWRGVPVRSDRWEVDDGGQGADGGPLWSVETRAGWTLLQDMEGDLEKPVAEHIAASDPHAVLALIAELRRVEQERDDLLDQRFLWLGRVLFPQLMDMPDDFILGRTTEGMSDAERAGMSDFRKRVEESPERIFRELMRGERIPYNDAGAALLQKADSDGAPPTDGFVTDAADRNPDDT